LSIKVLMRLSSVVIAKLLCLQQHKGLEVLPRYKYPMQTTTPAVLIPAANFVKSLLSTIWAVGKLYPVAILISALPALPIYRCAGNHVSMLRSKQLYWLLLTNTSLSP